MATKNIMIVGVGGQGTLLTSRILGGLAITGGYDVKLSEVHGMAQRGGSVVTFVRYGDQVAEPIVEEGQADVIIAFERLEALRYAHFLKKDGALIINDWRIDPMPVVIGAAEYPEDIIETLGKDHKVYTVNATEEAKKIGAVEFLAQGTIYPDVVESGLGGESAVIKSHHNVGGLPEYVDFKEIIEPLRDLFKDEVRKAGLELGLPEKLVFRQPFPGPGLGIRIIGEVTAEKVRIVQDADAIYREEIANAGLDRSIGQYFAALTNMRSVGVMGDERTYDYAVALRAVNTVDFMTAEAAKIPYEVLDKVMSRIINEVRGVNRVFYDLTSKPPGTIEFE